MTPKSLVEGLFDERKIKNRVPRRRDFGVRICTDVRGLDK